MNVRELGELGLIRRLRTTAPGSHAGIRLGIGDDAAVLEPTLGSAILATTDLVVEGIHFRREWASPRDIGWKAIAVNLSDIAAMGGIPRWALVALAIPAATPVEDVDALYVGMRDCASPHRVVIVGGDTSASPDGWMINVTLLGEHAGLPRLRSMVRPGDAIAVTGTLGRSAAGLALLAARSGSGRALPAGMVERLLSSHLRPMARVSEGRWLGSQPAVHALMDCSDGLATDVGHLCRESALHARVELARVPIDPAAREAAQALGEDALLWATRGGEDYELILTCDADAVTAVAAGLERETGTTLTVIGTAAPGAPEIAWVGLRGEAVDVRGGYEHFHG
jgi:thiamine-monophosphate kinase